ncbi:MAG: polysaccharide biosynthesis protein [Oscillospiraceae bacterium]|nr:polysaccharide biosynthesis protein [Oscillospiraceae bacterium]
MADTGKKNTFYGGAAILAVSTIVVKVIGALYRIPLGNILSDEAMADYNSAYNIYNVLLTVSTAGLPVALSKTISEANTLGRANQARKTFRVAFSTFLILGLISFFCMTVLSTPVSNILLSNPKAVYCVRALAPSLLCVCVVSAFRGYFQGHFNMVPTGVSQIIEAGCKLVIGLSLALYLVNVADMAEYGSVGAIIGVSTGSVAALAFISVLFLRHQKQQRLQPAADRPDGARAIAARLFKLAIPITISSGASSMITLIDGNLVMRQLQSLGVSVDGLSQEAALDAARGLYGIYSKTLSIYNLPFAMMVPLTACIIPAVSACLSRKDGRGAQRISESALRVGLLLALPMGMGLFALGGPIIKLMYPSIDSSVAGPLLSILGLASIFVSLQLLCNSILQANGLVNLPILAVLAGGVVKLVVNYILVGNPSVRINGAPVGSLCCFIVVAGLEIFFIRRTVPHPPRFLRAFVKPFVASALMATAAWASNGLLSRVLPNSLAVLGAIGIGVVVYLILVLVLHVISKDDLSLMPKGEKIAKILRIS